MTTLSQLIITKLRKTHKTKIFYTDIDSFNHPMNVKGVFYFLAGPVNVATSTVYFIVCRACKCERLQYTVIDWVQGQQQFCLTRGQICCLEPQAEGNRSVLGSN